MSGGLNSSDLEIDLLTNPEKVRSASDVGGGGGGYGGSGSGGPTIVAESIDHISLSPPQRKRSLSRISEEHSMSRSSLSSSSSSSSSSSRKRRDRHRHRSHGRSGYDSDSSSSSSSRSERSYSDNDEDDQFSIRSGPGPAGRPSSSSQAAAAGVQLGGSAKPKMTPEEVEAEKRKLLFALYRFQMKNNVQLPRELTMNSSLDEIQLAVDFCRREAKLSQAVKLSKNVLVTVCSGLEFLNEKYDPFDVYLTGWSETVKENEDEYDDVFEELFEKYQDKVAVSPEIKLMMMVVGSAAGYHLMYKGTKALSSSGMAQTLQGMAAEKKAPAPELPAFPSNASMPPPPPPPPVRTNTGPLAQTQMGTMTAMGLTNSTANAFGRNLGGMASIREGGNAARGTMRAPMSIEDLLQEAQAEEVMDGPVIAAPYSPDMGGSVMSVDVPAARGGRGGRGGGGRGGRAKKNSVILE